MADATRLVIMVSGVVQGVGFRAWAQRQALAQGLLGWARNTADGQVEIVAEGTRVACEALIGAFQFADPPGRVTDIAVTWAQPQHDVGDYFLTA